MSTMNTDWTRRDFLRAGGVAAAAALLPAKFGRAQATVAARRPNILVVLVDDMGYSDLGCFGSEIATPNLDQLARNGMIGTQFYNTARCCPSRAALLTGLYSHQAGVGAMTSPSKLTAYQGYLNNRCVTIPEVLRQEGYRTLMCGKWHVGGDYNRTRPETWTNLGDEQHPTPLQRGFDRFYGTLLGAGSYFDPAVLVRDDRLIKAEGDYYYTDALGDQAADLLGQTVTEGKPFFMYLAFTAPHFPLHARKADVAKYKGRYRDGPRALAQQRYKRQVELGIVDPKWPMRDDPTWETREPAVAVIRTEDGERAVASYDERMEVYAAMVDRMDQNMGKVLAKLAATGQLDNTVILFMSDNGGCAEPNAYGPCWATASNTPLRKWKQRTFEGGIATPLIAHWPGVIQGGQVTREVGHIIDVMPTCLEVGGATYPTQFGGRDIRPCEGRSLAPLLRSGRRKGHERLFWEHFGNLAVREGKWKLVRDRKTPWELYDLEADRQETNNLAQREPQKVRELAEAWEAWAQRVGALPDGPGKPGSTQPPTGTATPVGSAG